MKNNFGLTLNKLVVSNNEETREIEFYKGLNFISGPTDTGKTYIYQLLKYLLGSNDKPKNIPENKNFNNTFLDFTSNFNSKFYTLNRKLGTNKIYLYESELAKIKDSAIPIPLNTKGNSQLISKELMTIAGLETDKKIKTHIRDERYQNINFRDYLYHSMVDEVSIITDKSPLYSGQFVTQTFELNFFYYLVSNKNIDYLTYLSDQKQKKPRLKKIKVKPIDELITNTQQEIKELHEQLNKTDEVSYIDEIKAITTQINLKSEYLQQVLKDTEKIKSQILMNNELLKRFNLLKIQFASDLERLDFIIEGGNIISRLSIENCTVCGSQIIDDNHFHDERFEVTNIKTESLVKSYLSEKNKILINLKDLDEAVGSILNEIKDLNIDLKKHNTIYTDIGNQINKVLKPTRKNLEEKMQKIVEKKVIQQKIFYLTTIIETLNPDKGTNIPSLTIDNKQKNTYDQISLSIEKLCEIMCKHLDDMKFNGNDISTKIYFDYNERDFVINGKNRGVYGKGYRAIIYAVFLISLMEYCNLNSIPHAGFVVLDSPLTTYQEGDELSTEDIISDDLKKRFIKTFSKDKQNQIIILDNQFDLISNEFNYIKFTKKVNEGRYGFM